MFRWWFIVLVASAAFMLHNTPTAFACGNEGGNSTSGHNAIAFCCEGGSGDRGDKGGHGGHGKDARVISGHR